MAELSITGLSKRFGETVVLDDVTVEVPDGSFAVLVGPSGCGKSTLLRLIAGLETVDEGRIVMGDRDVTRLEPRERDVAMVFQSYALYPHLSVRDNLAFGLKLRKTSEDDITRRVREASDMLGIGHLLDRMPRALSGGQRQRVAMGRAIVRRPAVFLFDEPLSNLDAALRAQVRVDIRKLHDQLATTSVYVTHDQVEAMTLADRIAIMSVGELQQVGSPMEVYHQPNNRFVAGFIGSPAMNFVDGEVSGQGGKLRIHTGAFELPLDEVELVGAPEALRLDEGVELGIRPQHVNAVSDNPDGHGEVRHAEQMGSETFAHLDAGGVRFVARLPGDRAVSVGDVIPFRFDRRKMHLFTADGQNVVRGAIPVHGAHA